MPGEAWHGETQMLQIGLYLLLGALAGAISGVMGIGGGIILVPALVLLCGFTQQQAQGTTLALMVPPIGILAAWTYYKQGLVDLRVAGFICLGFILGSWLGADWAVLVPNLILKRIFGGMLLVIALKMLFS